jgi:hypothetical protein
MLMRVDAFGAGTLAQAGLCAAGPWGLASNTSFKVTRRSVTQFAVANWAPAHPAPQLDR